MKYLTRTFKGKKERVLVDIKDIEFMYLEAKFPIAKIAEAYMVTYQEMSNYINFHGLKEKRHPKTKSIHDVSSEDVFKKLMMYIKTIFGNNFTIKKSNDVTYIINDRWKFEWHVGFEKNTKRFIDIRGELSDIKITYEEWMSEIKNKNRYIAQYEVDGEFIRMWDSESEICMEYGVSQASLYHAKSKGNNLCGYMWFKVSDVNSLDISVSIIDEEDVLTKELLYDLYINQNMSIKKIVDYLNDKDVTYAKIRNRLLKHGIIKIGKINNKVSYNNGKLIKH